MEGKVSSEYELNVEASKAWKLYSTLELAKLIEEKLPLVHKIDVLEGDGGVGSVLHLTFAPDTGLDSYKEKFTKIDDEKRIKEVEVIEGGYLNLGFTLYRIRLEIIDKESNKCIIKSTIEYQIKEEAMAFAPSLVSIQPLEDIARIAALHLLEA